MRLTHAIILAAGLGTRMRPLTNDIPKPLIAVKGKPLMDYCLDWLAEASIGDVVINTSYLAEKLEAYLANRRTPRVQISREEPAPLETGGGIVKALPMLGKGPFLAMNSDAIFAPTSPHPIACMAAEWRDDLDFLMLLIPKENAVGWEEGGDFILGEGGRIRRPRAGEEAPYIFAGVEIIHPRVFDGAPSGAFSLSTLWNARAGADGFLHNVRALVHTGDWLNVGDLAGLKAAEDYVGGGGGGASLDGGASAGKRI